MKEGWGHTSVYNLCDFAVEIGVDDLILFHHDPDRTDDILDEITRKATIQRQPHGVSCSAAYQGMTIDTSEA